MRRLRMVLFACLLFFGGSGRVYAEDVVLAKSWMQPGRFYTWSYAYFGVDKSENPYITMKNVVDDALNGRMVEYIDSRAAKLWTFRKDDRLHIAYDDVVCARKWRIFNNFKVFKHRCRPMVIEKKLSGAWYKILILRITRNGVVTRF